jgi:hypothetical protein
MKQIFLMLAFLAGIVAVNAQGEASLCLTFTSRAYAQRSLPGMRGLQLTAGFADGTDGYYLGAAMATYAKNANKWLVGAGYLEKGYSYNNGNIPLAQFTVEGGYYVKFLSDPRKTVFFSLGASALGGYETVNWNEKRLFDGATLQNDDAFLYGGALTLEMETYLTNRVVCLVNVRERFLAGSSVGKFSTQLGVGIKLIIN